MEIFVSVLVLLAYLFMGMLFTEMVMGEETRIYYTGTYVCTSCGWIFIIPIMLMILVVDLVKRKVSGFKCPIMK